MKKALFVLMALLIASPAMAVTFVVTDNADLTATIGYAGNGTGAMPDAARARAFGLKISVSDGAIITAVDGFQTGEGNKYGIFPGNIDLTNPENPIWNTPVEGADLPGATGTGLNTSTIIVAMGSLYTGTAPGAAGDLLTITVDKPCTVTVEEEDQYRGGVVAEDAQPMTVALVSQAITGSEPAVCLGDLDGDTYRSPDDMYSMIGLLEQASALDYWIPSDNPLFNPAGDIDADTFMSPDDMYALIGILEQAAANDYWSPCNQ